MQKVRSVHENELGLSTGASDTVRRPGATFDLRIEVVGGGGGFVFGVCKAAGEGGGYEGPSASGGYGGRAFGFVAVGRDQGDSAGEGGERG